MKILENRVVSILVAALFSISIAVPAGASTMGYGNFGDGGQMTRSYHYADNGLMVATFDMTNNSVTIYEDGRRSQQRLRDEDGAVTLEYVYEDGKLHHTVDHENTRTFFENGRASYVVESDIIIEGAEFCDKTGDYIYECPDTGDIYIQQAGLVEGEDGEREIIPVWVKTTGETETVTVETATDEETGEEVDLREIETWVPHDDVVICDDEDGDSQGYVLLDETNDNLYLDPDEVEYEVVENITAEYEYNSKGQVERIIDPRFYDEDGNNPHLGVTYHRYEGHVRVESLRYDQQLDMVVSVSYDGGRESEVRIADSDGVEVFNQAAESDEFDVVELDTNQTNEEGDSLAGRLVSKNIYDGPVMLATFMYNPLSLERESEEQPDGVSNLPTSVILYDSHGRRRRQYSFDEDGNEYEYADLSDVDQDVFESLEELGIESGNDMSIPSLTLQQEWTYSGAFLIESRSYPDGAGEDDEGVTAVVTQYNQFGDAWFEYEENSANPDPGLETPVSTDMTSTQKFLFGVACTVAGWALTGSGIGALAGGVLGLLEAEHQVVAGWVEDLGDTLSNLFG